MAVIEIAKIQVRRGQENQTGEPRLDPGEFGWAQDTENLYIGKRVSEGASTDENTRLLTENDLNNIFTLLGAASTITLVAPYEYRDGLFSPDTSVRLLQSKLDDLEPSLADFGVTPGMTATNITVQLKNAVEDLFGSLTWDSPERAERRRTLKIPAGNYIVSDYIDLPPYTTIVGEGQELTKITLVTTSTGIFRTVDAEGHTFATMQTGVKRSREVKIEGMTLEYANTLTFTTMTSVKALVSLDNVLDAKINNVGFRTQINSTSTTTYGMVDYGVGIHMRGLGGGIISGDANLCENLLITHCTFDSLKLAVEGTGTVVRPMITNSLFNNLQQGLYLHSTDTNPPPTNGVFKDNRFQNIVKEAIYVGTSTYRTAHLSEKNFFVQVGNGVDLVDFTTTAHYPVIRFAAPGNKSNNDYFNRRKVAYEAGDTSGFYYTPEIIGRTTLNDSSVFTATVVAGGLTRIAKVAITGEDIMANMKYQITNPGLSRKGNVLINITPDGYVAFTDTHNYVENMTEVVPVFTTATTVLNTIITATQTNPVVLGFNAYHYFGTGTTEISVTGMNGMTQLNGNHYWVTPITSSSVSLYSDPAGSVSVDGTGFGLFTSGGTAQMQLTTSQLCVNTNLYPIFAGFDFLTEGANWNITYNDPTSMYYNKVANLTSYRSNHNGIAVIDTFSEDPVFDFLAYTTTTNNLNYALLNSEVALIDVNYQTNHAISTNWKNYIDITCSNASTSTTTNSVIEFQIDILS